MTHFWMQKSVPKITLVVERHGKSTWLMLQPAEGKSTKLAKFKSEDAAREFWRAYSAHGLSMHALGALGI
jgi:hypothetical protein